jgi:hypothetical protein
MRPSVNRGRNQYVQGKDFGGCCKQFPRLLGRLRKRLAKRMAGEGMALSWLIIF